jgi:hypothetical protein
LSVEKLKQQTLGSKTRVVRDQMKSLKWIAAGLVMLAVGATKTVVGQDAASAVVQDSFASANVSLESASDEQIMLQAVESVTPVPFANIPPKQRAGTFWSAQHPPDGSSPWPPLPGNIFVSSAKTMGRILRFREPS